MPGGKSSELSKQIYFTGIPTIMYLSMLCTYIILHLCEKNVPLLTEYFISIKTLLLYDNFTLLLWQSIICMHAPDGVFLYIKSVALYYQSTIQ